MVDSESNATTAWLYPTVDVADDFNGTALFPSINNHSTSAAPQFVRFRDDSRFWVQKVLLPIIGTIGLFGNAVTIFVLTRKGMRSSTNAYLTALAIADIIYLICVLWLSLIHYPSLDDDPIWTTIYAHVWRYSLWLTDASTNTSVWLTVSFTIERYIAVCHPIRGRMLCTESRARRVIVAVYLICFSAALSTAFEWTVETVTDPLTNVTKAIRAQSSLANDETYRFVFYWFTSITFVLLPLTLLIIFNSFLIQSVRQSKKLRQVMTACQNSDREERAASNEIKITITLIAVVLLFLICQLPTAATLIYKIFHEPKAGTDADNFLLGLGNIFNFLVSVNAACNFLLYCALSDKYRRTFIWAICRCFQKTPSPVHSTAFCNNTVHHDQIDLHCHNSRSHVTSFRGPERYCAVNSGRCQPPRGSPSPKNNSKCPSLPLDGNGSAASRNTANESSPTSAHRLSHHGTSNPTAATTGILPSATAHRAISSGGSLLATTPPRRRVRLANDCWPLKRNRSFHRNPSPAKSANIVIQISDAGIGDTVQEPFRQSQHYSDAEEVAFV